MNTGTKHFVIVGGFNGGVVALRSNLAIFYKARFLSCNFQDGICGPSLRNHKTREKRL